MAEIVPETRDRILEGALQALGRVGPRRLTMTDVSDRAGLSRGTVYRYFPTKDDLLEVVAQYEQDRFSGGLRSRLAEIPPEEHSLEIVVEYIISYLRRHPALPLMIDVEPEFVLTFLRRQMPVFHRITEELLGPVLADARPIREGWLTLPELNDLLLRTVLSVFLVPGGSGITEGVLGGALDSFLRLVTSAETPGRLGRRRPA